MKKIFSDEMIEGWDPAIVDIAADAFRLQLKAKKLETEQKRLAAEAKAMMDIVFSSAGLEKIESLVGTFSKVKSTNNKLDQTGLKTWLMRKGIDSDLIKAGFDANTKQTISEYVKFVAKKEGKK